MRLKDGVTITKRREQEYILNYRGREKAVRPEQVYLLEALQSGIRDNRVFVSLIMDRERCGETASGFVLAGFLIDYGDFLEKEDYYYYEIVD